MPITQSPPGGGQLSPLAPTDLRAFAAAAAITASAAYLHKFRVSAPTTITTIKILCAANASGFNGDAGIFTLAGSTYTLARSSGSTVVAAAATGVLSFALTSAYVAVPGVDYWMAFAADSATPTFGRIAPVSAAALLDAGVAIAKTSQVPLASFSTPVSANAVLQIWAV